MALSRPRVGAPGLSYAMPPQCSSEAEGLTVPPQDVSPLSGAQCWRSCTAVVGAKGAAVLSFAAVQHQRLWLTANFESDPGPEAGRPTFSPPKGRAGKEEEQEDPKEEAFYFLFLLLPVSKWGPLVVVLGLLEWLLLVLFRGASLLLRGRSRTRPLPPAATGCRRAGE